MRSLRRAVDDEEVIAGAADQGASGLGRSSMLRGLLAVVSPVAPATLAPRPASARGLNEVNKDIVSYGVPEMAYTKDVPFGWTYEDELIGTAIKNAEYGKIDLGTEPLVVAYAHPANWITSKPVIDENGAAGTVAANDFNKGDSATLWVDTAFKGQLADLKLPEYAKELRKAVTQKGGGLVNSMKVEKVVDGEPGYKLCQYSYEIEGGAGIPLLRLGWAAFAQAGTSGNLQVFWSVCTLPRWKAQQETLKSIASSFRAGKVPPSIAKEYVVKIEQF